MDLGSQEALFFGIVAALSAVAIGVLISFFTKLMSRQQKENKALQRTLFDLNSSLSRLQQHISDVQADNSLLKETVAKLTNRIEALTDLTNNLSESSASSSSSSTSSSSFLPPPLLSPPSPPRPVSFSSSFSSFRPSDLLDPADEPKTTPWSMSPSPSSPPSFSPFLEDQHLQQQPLPHEEDVSSIDSLDSGDRDHLSGLSITRRLRDAVDQQEEPQEEDRQEKDQQDVDHHEEDKQQDVDQQEQRQEEESQQEEKDQQDVDQQEEKDQQEQPQEEESQQEEKDQQDVDHHEADKQEKEQHDVDQVPEKDEKVLISDLEIVDLQHISDSDDSMSDSASDTTSSTHSDFEADSHDSDLISDRGRRL